MILNSCLSFSSEVRREDEGIYRRVKVVPGTFRVLKWSLVTLHLSTASRLEASWVLTFSLFQRRRKRERKRRRRMEEEILSYETILQSEMNSERGSNTQMLNLLFHKYSKGTYVMN